MAQNVLTFEVQLADVDGGRYETLDFRLAWHPSETEHYLVTRALAYCLSYTSGITLSPGLCAGDEPPIYIMSDDGRRLAWIDVGRPPPNRIRKAAISCERVCVFTWRDPNEVHRHVVADVRHRSRLEVVGIESDLVYALAADLKRRNLWSVTVSGGHVYVADGSNEVGGALTRVQETAG